ncbi:hypothetical protein ACJD0Z_05320 [Flavobacteriaceae bacterium M23B6Z8]
MSLLIFLSALIAVITYLLFVPVILVIDTANENYYIKIKGFAKAALIGDNKHLIKVKLKVLFLSFDFYPLLEKDTSSKRVKEKNTKGKKLKVFNFKTFLRMLSSFRIKKCYLDIDTGDCIQNAKLYPIFGFLNLTKGVFRVNFEGKNSLLLCVENRPIRLIKSLINF